jgi:hypothetical protein
VILKAIDRQLALMMAGPVAFAFPLTIDKEVTNAVRAKGSDGDWPLMGNRTFQTNSPLCDVHHFAPIPDRLLSSQRFSLRWEMTMSTNTNHTTGPALGAYLVHLFKVDADQFQLPGQNPRADRGSEYLNRPYELGELMHRAAGAGVWPLGEKV